MNYKLNVGLIGIGRMGRNYADYLANRILLTNLLAICDLNEKLMASCAKDFGVSKCFKNYQDLIADEEIDAVVIVTSTHSHKEIIVEAAKHGKAIFCEKPLTLSLKEALEINQTLTETGVFFHMGFVRRFDKGYAAAKRKIEKGMIGEPVVFKSSSRDPYRPSLEFLKREMSGGIFVDMGIHDFDIARWFMGDIKTVYSIGGTLAYPEMEKIGDIDNGITNLTFENHTLGVVDLSRNGVYGYDIRTEILGTKGTLKIGYLRETPLLVMTKDGICHDTVPYFMQRFGEAYITQLQNFAENYLQGKEPAITYYDGLEALKISLAARLSFDDDQPVEMKKIHLND
ncbi:MAG: inositol 2-dehydrogenase [bacterium]